MRHRRNTIVLIFIVSIIRLILANSIELSNDEVYYRLYADHLQWNYFDHPPMVAFFIRIFTFNLYFDNELFIRLAAVCSSAACTWLMFLIGRQLRNERTGFIAALLYTACFYSSVIAGLMILPDSPQLVFWIASVYLMLRIVERNLHNEDWFLNWLLLGVTSGLCIISKVHGVFLWLGFGAFVLFRQRALLKRPGLYIALLLCVIIILPSFLWTWGHKFSTVAYHSSRISFLHHWQPDSFFSALGGSVLYMNPLVYILILTTLVATVKRKLVMHTQDKWLLLWLGFPLIMVVAFMSLFNDTLPHWSGPGYVTLLGLTAVYLDRRYDGKIPSILKWATGITGGGTVIAMLMVLYWPGSLGSTQLPDYGKHDVTLDMCGWRQFQQRFDAFLKEDTSAKRGKPYIFTDYWFPGGHLSYYVARPMNATLKVTGSQEDIHHFAWLNEYNSDLTTGADAWYINISNFYNSPPTVLTKYFKKVSVPVAIPQYRNGFIVRYFYLYKLIGYNGGIPANGILK
ncbi:MAG: glycosyltransferase family 39 protein [Chitinophagaceae bacterium]